MKRLLAGLFSLAALSFSPAAHAQTLVNIMWSGGAQDIIDDSDVFTGGTIVQAYNIGTPAATAATIGSLTFDAVGVPSDFSTQSVPFGTYTFAEDPGYLSSMQINNAGRFDIVFASLSDGYQTLLMDGAFAALPGTITLTMDSLEIGNIYAFQWWSSDASIPGSFGDTTATGGLTLTADAGGLGQYGLGAFIATDTTMAIQFESTNNLPLINGFQLRDLGPSTPVPEPSTYAALAGVAALGFVFLRRRRAA